MRALKATAVSVAVGMFILALGPDINPGSIVGFLMLCGALWGLVYRNG